MPRCTANKPDGTPCERIVGSAQSYCYSHDPNRREERQRNAARGGRGGSNSEIRELKGQLSALYEDVLSGRVDKADAAVANQILNTRARLIEIERRVREAEELEARLEVLEGIA